MFSTIWCDLSRSKEYIPASVNHTRHVSCGMTFMLQQGILRRFIVTLNYESRHWYTMDQRNRACSWESQVFSRAARLLMEKRVHVHSHWMVLVCTYSKERTMRVSSKMIEHIISFKLPGTVYYTTVDLSIGLHLLENLSFWHFLHILIYGMIPNQLALLRIFMSPYTAKILDPKPREFFQHLYHRWWLESSK